MKLITFAIVILGLSTFPLSAQHNTKEQEKLINLDAAWEKAQLALDFDFLKSILAEEFIWVHNHAGTIDDKAAVLERTKRYLSNPKRNTKSRTSKDVKVIIAGSTGIVHGYTVVDKVDSSTTYHFMRTYVETNGKHYLIANHTMAIPDKE